MPFNPTSRELGMNLGWSALARVRQLQAAPTSSANHRTTQLFGPLFSSWLSVPTVMLLLGDVFNLGSSLSEAEEGMEAPSVDRLGKGYQTL